MLAKIPFTNVTREIIAAAIEVHRVIGPGLLESAYASCLRHELSTRRLPFTSERGVPLVYKGTHLDCAYRLDLLVKDVIVVEVKAVATVLPIHQAQLLTYLRLADLPVGLVINFEVERLVDGVKRVINPRWSGATGGRSIAAGGGLP
jgi:GxxExxY protein